MRFLADMGISPRTVEFLTGLGHDATHLSTQGLNRMPDPEILRKARDESRVLLAHDLDFGELMAASGARLPSVIIFRLRNMRPDLVNLRLRHVIADIQDELETGAIVSVSEQHVRTRKLPIIRGNQ